MEFSLNVFFARFITGLLKPTENILSTAVQTKSSVLERAKDMYLMLCLKDVVRY